MQSVSLTKARWSSKVPLELPSELGRTPALQLKKMNKKPSPGSGWFMLDHKWLIKVCHNRNPISRKEIIVYGSCAIGHRSLVYSVLVIKFYRLII